MTHPDTHDFSRDEFLDVLAHELRNPLAPLRNGLQVLRLLPEGSPRPVETLDVMERQLGRLVNLIDSLLDASRVQRGGIELHRDRVALAEIVNAAVESAQERLTGHAVAVRLPAAPVFLRADAERMKQVLVHLIDNAVKYSAPDGPISLSAVVEEAGGTVVLSVADQGVGISGDLLSGVFEMFGRAGRSLEHSQTGLGIGLAIVRRLVEMHGGSVEARSDGPGAGSEFLIRLPVLSDVSTVPVKMSESSGLGGMSASPSRRRLLVVDDDADCADSLAMMLRVMGHEAVIARDGMDTLRVAAEFRPDIILLDLGMPKLDGYDACRVIRQQPWAKETLIVAVTGWGDEEDRRRSRDAGFDHHLVKPVEIDTLQKITESLCV